MQFRSIVASSLMFLLGSFGPAVAATLTPTGATGIELSGAFYDVTFVDGSCAEVFDGCNNSNFFFSSTDETRAATLALFDLFNSPGNEALTDNPELINGCESVHSCSIHTGWFTTVFQTDGLQRVFGSYLTVYDETNLLMDHVWDGYEIALGNGSSSVHAVWSVASVAAVPLPAGLVLLLTSLGGLALVKSRKHTTV